MATMANELEDEADLPDITLPVFTVSSMDFQVIFDAGEAHHFVEAHRTL